MGCWKDVEELLGLARASKDPLVCGLRDALVEQIEETDRILAECLEQVRRAEMEKEQK